MHARHPKRLFLASSTPLAIAASRTSLALALRADAEHAVPSPTTTSAVKAQATSALHDMATRLIFTTRSMYVLFSAWGSPRRPSRRSRRSPPPVRCHPCRQRGAAVLPSSGPYFLVSFISCGEVVVRAVIGKASPPSRAPSARGGDPTVVAVAGAVEHHRVDTGVLGPGRHQTPDLARLRSLVRGAGSQPVLHGGRRRQRVPGVVVDDLHEHVPAGPGHDETRPSSRAGDLLPDPDVTARPIGPPPCPGHASLAKAPCLLPSLSDLAADVLALVTHALALVRVGLAQLADLGRGLAPCCLSMPLTVNRVGVSTANVIPSGGVT